MLDTKLKSRHKLAVFLIATILVISSLVVITGYGKEYREGAVSIEEAKKSYLSSESFLTHFSESSYILYNMENGMTGEVLEEVFQSVYDSYESIYPFIDFQMTDADDKVLQKDLPGSVEKIEPSDLEEYAIGISIHYDQDGKAEAELLAGDDKGIQSSTLKRTVSNLEVRDGYYMHEGTESVEVNYPRNCTFLYGFSEGQLEEFLEEEFSFYYMTGGTTEGMLYKIIMLCLFVAAAALVLPHWKTLNTGNEKVFCLHVEAPLAAGVIAAIYVSSTSGWLVNRNQGNANMLDFLFWTLFFWVAYWLAATLRQIVVVGPHTYLKERTLTWTVCKYVKKAFFVVKNGSKKHIEKFYKSLDDINLDDKNSKLILKIVGVNFVIVLVFCTLWFFGIMGLIVYSVVLFFILRKYFNDLREKYRILLKATNEIAEGNLDVQINEDLGVFSPFRSEIEKIQGGFKKAVDEEVKSQKMKTELVTNVSHDLKTPLTAIITYVNLLKDEKDEEKRKDYVDVLERKSLRLKALIEDLFEISKASSQNVTLNLIQVDIVNLFKQVKLELDDKINTANLEFRMDFPEEKLILTLDSQKTYRIFENLLGNVVKYALPHTRVYVSMEKEENNVVIRMKNISATELTFNSEEITDRFVRGDAARNTEGSGLGLAIAKSFVELQKGTLKIETEADLFKVEIRWKI